MTLLVGTSPYLGRVLRTRDVNAIRRIWEVYRPLERAGIAAVTLGIIFELVTAIVGPFDLTHRWLLVAYVLVALLFKLGPIEGAMYAKVIEPAKASPGDVPSAELELALDDRRRFLMTTASVMLYVAVIFTMITKLSF